MDDTAAVLDPIARRTRAAFLWTSLLKTPFWTLYGLLGFILYKDLHASSFQLALFLALRPAVSLISIYWSSFVKGRRDRLKSNIIIGSILGYLPFFFFPFVSEPYFFIISGALYMMLTRGVTPAWMEILKLNIAPSVRQKVFAYGSTVSYVGSILLPILMGDMLDLRPGIWRWLFPACSALGLLSICFQLKIFIAEDSVQSEPTQGAFSLKKTLVGPWQQGLKLLKERSDFSRFQIGFFLGGMGLVLMQPALPKFFFDGLHISYAELAIALSACKGIGFAVSSKFLSSLMQRLSIFRFSGIVTLLAALFPLILLCASYHTTFLYLSYLIYGVMQAGSELCWHMSGPMFARHSDSSVYSSVNLAMVGIRGCIAHFMGSLLCSLLGAPFVLVFCFVLSLIATWHLRLSSQRTPLVESGE